MAHFAQIDDNNVVLDVVVVDNHRILDQDGQESEEIGVSWLKFIYGFKTNWIKTSYNNSFRGRFAVIGGTYDPAIDAFKPPKPGDHFIYDENVHLWVPDPKQHDPELLQLGIPLSELS